MVGAVVGRTQRRVVAAVARAAAGCDAIVNFAAETHVDRSILGPKEFVSTDVLGTMTLRDWARANDARFVRSGELNRCLLVSHRLRQRGS